MTDTAEGTADRSPVELAVSKRRALQSLSTPGHMFAILAVDHIGALSRVIRSQAPESVVPKELVEYKVRLVESLADLASGILIDPVLGLEPMIRDDALPGDTGLMVGLEDGDYASLDDKPRLFKGWNVERAARAGATAIKCSFFYDPFSDSEAAHAFVSELVDGCDRFGLPLFAEPLAPDADQADRRSVVVETAKRIGALGVDILKLEFPLVGSSDEHEWRDACLEVTEASPRPWTLLSGGENYETYAGQLRVACGAGASGFVAGRSVWNDLVEGGLPFQREVEQDARRRFKRLAEIARDSGTPWTDWFEQGGSANRARGNVSGWEV